MSISALASILCPVTKEWLIEIQVLGHQKLADTSGQKSVPNLFFNSLDSLWLISEETIITTTQPGITKRHLFFFCLPFSGVLPRNYSSYSLPTLPMAPIFWKHDSLASFSKRYDLNLSLISLFPARWFPFPYGNYFLILIDSDQCHLLAITS